MSKRTVVLIILDGWGIGKHDASNPIFQIKPKNIEFIKSNFPAGALQASGIAVGLPWQEEGNSEVGHLNIGAGKVIYQNYPKISLAIREESFFKNEVLKAAFDHAKKNNSAVNLIGLLTDANVHASYEHLKALIEFSKRENVEKLNLHLITDGRDSPPQSAIELINRLGDEKSKLASVAGRYYGMDRDKHWDRTQNYYSAITGNGIITDLNNLENHIKGAYEKGLNDEYVVPTLIGPEKRFISDNDAVIFFNFREDRMRQIVDSFITKDFDKFPRKLLSNLYIATLVGYDNRFSVPVAFSKDASENPLSKILADNNKTQFRIAETEKYAHVTYFFNGEKELPFQNEFRVIIPSRSDIHHDEHPEMRAREITERLLSALEEEGYDFILANLANADMVAHTGNYEATVEAIKIIDEEVGKIVSAVLEHNDFLIITSDHGNAERMFNPLTGEPETKHDPSPVPIYLVAKEFQRPKTEIEMDAAEKNTIGILADVAPTILEIMGIPKPKEITGQSLLKFLR
ncbi:MAG: 2,3-bisphosphoglycerate-independent phosphoglycerate mutase [Patescibacteria group bacterium]